MPLWLIITLVGVALVIAGFAGLGTTGLVTAVLAQRRARR